MTACCAFLEHELRSVWWMHLLLMFNQAYLPISWFFCFVLTKTINEPRHDKTNKRNVRPAKTQISLGIRPV